MKISAYENILAYRLANKLFLKVADLAAIAGDYYKSIEHYEKVAKSSVANNLMKWSVKDYFLKAGICHLAANVRAISPSPYILLHHLLTTPPFPLKLSAFLHANFSSSSPLPVLTLYNTGHRSHSTSPRDLPRPRLNIRLNARTPAARRSGGSRRAGRPGGVRR